MDSVGSPKSWAPYYNYRDCSQGICSLYCPRWCSGVIFSPPPPFVPDNDSGTNLSPFIIAVISILACGFLLVTYYIIVSKYCRRRGDQNPAPELEANLNQIVNHGQRQQVASTGLDETFIKSITVFRYKKGDGLIEGTECAVCLSEFQQDERLRLLPECSHAFHLPCIDTWLKSHRNCPICRASVVSSYPLPPPPSSTERSSALNVSSLQIQHQNDLVLVVDDPERAHREEVVVTLVSDVAPKNMDEIGEEGAQQFRRSISLDSFSSQRQLLVTDILHIKEDDEDLQMEIHQRIRGENSRRHRAAMRRSISTGRFSCSQGMIKARVLSFPSEI